MVSEKRSVSSAVEAMCKLVRDGEAAGADPANDKWAAELNIRASTFQEWLDGLEDVLDRLGVSPPKLPQQLHVTM